MDGESPRHRLTATPSNKKVFIRRNWNPIPVPPFSPFVDKYFSDGGGCGHAFRL